MSGIICESCGRDIDALGQDNMSCTSEPLCEDCRNERQSHAVAALKRENASLRRRNESLDESRKVLGLQLAEANRKLREDGARPEATKFAADAVKDARLSIEAVYKVSRERALALTKLDECEMWLERCKPKETAAPAHGEAAANAAQRVDVDVRVQAIEPDGGEVELLGGGAAGCRLAAENLLELLRGLPDSLARTLAVRAAEECALWIDEIEEDE